MQSKRRSWKDDHYGKPRRRSCNAGKESVAHRRRPTGRLNHLSRLAGYRQLGLLWSSIFVTLLTVKIMFFTSVRIVLQKVFYNYYTNAVSHDCM